MTSAERRREAILRLIVEHRIETQKELVTALAETGIDASQASVSRDIAALRLIKVAGRWAAPTLVLEVSNPLEERIAGRALSVAAAGDHLLVLKTPPGEAQGVALALDGLELAGVVGTVAGDDTILIAVADAEARDTVGARLRELMAR